MALAIALAIYLMLSQSASAAVIETVLGERVEGRLIELRGDRVVVSVRAESGEGEREIEVPLESVDVITRWAGADRRIGVGGREGIRAAAVGAPAMVGRRVAIGPIVIGGQRVAVAAEAVAERQAQLAQAAADAHAAAEGAKRAAVAGADPAAIEALKARRARGEAVDVSALAESASGDSAASKPWRIVLSNGDQIDAVIESWSADGIALKPSVLGDVTLNPPVGQVQQVWRLTSATSAEASPVLSPEEAASGLDVAIVNTPENMTVRVLGRSLRIDGDQLVFHHKDQDRPIALDRLIALIRATPAGNPGPATRPAGGQVVRLQDGQVVHGRWNGMLSSTITLTSEWDQEWTIPQDRIVDMRNQVGSIVRLTDLDPASVEETPYFDRVMHYRKNTTLSGAPLVLGDTTFALGLAMHARCVMTFNLPDGFDRLNTTVGFEQPVGRIGRASIRVLGDGKVLHDVSDARGDQPPTRLDLAIAGVKRLTLEVDFGADQDTGDRVIWGDPRLMRGKPLAVSTPAPK